MVYAGKHLHNMGGMIPPRPLQIRLQFSKLNDRGAFTLLELLIVVSIVAVLTAIAIPALGMTMRSAELTKCSNNLRQVGLAATLFAADHHGLLPAEGNKGDKNPQTSLAWFYRLPPYLDMKTANDPITVFQCPNFKWAGSKVFDHATPKSYKMNSYLDADGRPIQYMLANVWDESEIPLFITATAGETGMGQWGHCPASAVETKYHYGKANMLMLNCRTQSVALKPEDGDWRKALKWESEQWE